MNANKRPNPAHHNYGRAQHPKTKLSGKINWLAFQISGAYANFQHSGFDITRDPMFKELKPEYQSKFIELVNEIRNSTLILKDAVEELKALNGPEKWNTCTPLTRIWTYGILLTHRENHIRCV